MFVRKQETLEAVLNLFFLLLSHLPSHSSFLSLLGFLLLICGFTFGILSGWIFGILEFCSFAVFFWKPFLSLVLRWFRTTRSVLVRESFPQDCYFLMEDKDTRMFLIVLTTLEPSPKDKRQMRRLATTSIPHQIS